MDSFKFQVDSFIKFGFGNFKLAVLTVIMRGGDE